MAKDRERQTAKLYYVEHNLTAKEVAQRVGCAEKTIGEWVAKYHWKQERDAKNLSPAKRLNNIKEIISKLSEEWLDLNRQVKELEEAKAEPKEISEVRMRIRGVDDAVSKWNKTLENIEKETNIPLATYLSVMESVFQALMRHDRTIYMNLLDFQEQHITDVSEKLG